MISGIAREMKGCVLWASISDTDFQILCPALYPVPHAALSLYELQLQFVICVSFVGFGASVA
jgi:hypothetical protein